MLASRQVLRALSNEESECWPWRVVETDFPTFCPQRNFRVSDSGTPRNLSVKLDAFFVAFWRPLDTVFLHRWPLRTAKKRQYMTKFRAFTLESLSLTTVYTVSEARLHLKDAALSFMQAASHLNLAYASFRTSKIRDTLPCMDREISSYARLEPKRRCYYRLAVWPVMNQWTQPNKTCSHITCLSIGGAGDVSAQT